MGTLLGSAVVPIALCITWKKANRMGCIAGAVIGLACGLMSWLVATSTLNGGVINVTVGCKLVYTIYDLELTLHNVNNRLQVGTMRC